MKKILIIILKIILILIVIYSFVTLIVITFNIEQDYNPKTFGEELDIEQYQQQDKGIDKLILLILLFASAFLYKNLLSSKKHKVE